MTRNPSDGLIDFVTTHNRIVTLLMLVSTGVVAVGELIGVSRPLVYRPEDARARVSPPRELASRYHSTPSIQRGLRGAGA